MEVRSGIETSRRRGWLVFLVGLALASLIVTAALSVYRNPVPQTIHTTDNGASIYFTVDRTHFVFPAECSTGRWQVEGIREVYFVREGVIGSGELSLCTGEAPYLKIILLDGSSRSYTVERDVLMLHPVIAVLSLSTLTLFSMAAYWLGAGRILRTRYGEYSVIGALAFVLVLILMLYTGSKYIVVAGTTYDAGRTYEIALNGWIGNPELWSPWAYRPLVPLAARFVSDLLAQPLDVGFAILSFSGMVTLLILAYATARHFGADFRTGLIVMLVIWLSYFIVRFTLGDIYRPDQWAYPLMLLALLMLFQKRWGWCLAVCCVGILVREFMVIPAILLALILALDTVRRRSLSSFLWLIITGVAVSLVVLLPRRLIPVAGNLQIFSPESSGLIYSVMQPLNNTPRNVELVMGLLVLMLPLLLLATPQRIRSAWKSLEGYRWLLGLYSLLTLGLVMYGGSGVQRYLSYLFVPLIIVLSLWLKNVSMAEVLFMLVAVALCNRLFWMVDIDPVTNWVTLAEYHEVAPYLPRYYELALYFGAALILRWLIFNRYPAPERDAQ